MQDKSNASLIDNGELSLVLTQTGGGTKLSSTRAILYGSITASIKTVGAPGVVTAFITMSGVKVSFTLSNEECFQFDEQVS